MLSLHNVPIFQFELQRQKMMSVLPGSGSFMMLSKLVSTALKHNDSGLNVHYIMLYRQIFDI